MDHNLRDIRHSAVHILCKGIPFNLIPFASLPFRFASIVAKQTMTRSGDGGFLIDIFMRFLPYPLHDPRPRRKV